MKQHRFRRLLSLLATGALLVSLMPAAFAADSEKHITILGTSDMHGNIWGYSYEDSAESTNNGMARLYTYIQQVRAENPNTILIDRRPVQQDPGGAPPGHGRHELHGL